MATPRTRRRTRRSSFAAACVALAAHGARAEEPRVADRVDVHAQSMELDARTRELWLTGDVRVDLPPFYLRADKLRLRRDERGAVDVQGPVTFGFCPCASGEPPLALRFERATAAPPGDLLLTGPRLEVYGAPVLWAPWFWLRSPGRAGLLPPELAYRGGDGVFAGGGVHAPWRDGDEARGIDLRAGGYVQGGAAVSSTLITPSSATRIAWDHLRGDGLTLDARGALEGDGTTTAWDADAIRGARGVAATTDLDAAARPYDRLRVASAWRDGGWTFGASLRSTTARGGALDDLGAAGPVATLRNAGAIATAGAYDAAIEGGAMSAPAARFGYARGEGGALLADRWGALGASLAVRGAGDAVSRVDRDAGVSRSGGDGAASARARLALPLARAWSSGDPRDPSDANDPWIHRVEPAIDAAVLSARGDDLLGVAPGRGGGAIHGDAWLAGGTLATTLGRWGARLGGEASLSAGALGSLDDSTSPRGVLRGRIATTSRYVALAGEGAHVFAGDAAGPGGAFVARARVGERQGLHASVYVADRDGVDPVAARALTDAPLEPSGGFLASPGWTAGGVARIPWSRGLATTAGADADLTAQVLVAARGGIELRDRCGCFRVRLEGAHRLGREGVDVWLAIDLLPGSP